jgi:hypothetical protein
MCVASMASTNDKLVASIILKAGAISDIASCYEYIYIAMEKINERLQTRSFQRNNAEGDSKRHKPICSNLLNKNLKAFALMTKTVQKS